MLFKKHSRYGMISLFISLVSLNTQAEIPQALSKVYIPDFSYAGYQFGEKKPDISEFKVINVADHGIVADDNVDDTTALNELLVSLVKQSDPVVIQFNQGRYQLSEIIRINRSNIVIRGAGTDVESGTEFFFPRPLIYAKQPREMDELAEYLVKFKKIEKNANNGILQPFSKWSWSGGFFWTGVPGKEGERVKSYLKEYEHKPNKLASVLNGNKDAHTFEVNSSHKLAVGDVVQMNWFNPEGKNGSYLKELYGDTESKIGSHHWKFPDMALARQQVLITDISGNKVTIKTPLLHNIKPNWQVSITQWSHLKEVGFEHFRITFPPHEQIEHHVEAGFNGIYLTRLFNSWVKDIVIDNADSGVLSENMGNVTIENVRTTGTSIAHYSVQIGGVNNVLVKDLTVDNPVIHPISFNTLANKNVYLNTIVNVQPTFDQHCGANQQNLFDNTKVKVTLDLSENKKPSYPLFKGGGAPYWKPTHGQFNTFWNTKVEFTNGSQVEQPIILNGIKDAPNGRIVGFSSNLPIELKYDPSVYLEGIGHFYTNVPSLYEYQLNKRLNGK
ncbi:MAG: glycosyl hydrolase family 28-related protein [Thalassotalea sp.]